VASVSGKLAKLSLGLAAIVGPAAAVGVAFKSFNAAADLEQTQVALRTLVGDIELADLTLTKIRKLAASTPFQFPELADSTRKLIAFGEEAESVPDTLRRVGDVAAGVQAPLGELVEVYGKARTQGTLYAEDLNQLTGRGIPILDEMAKILGVQVSQIKKLGSEGKLTFPLLEEAFRNLTGEGGKFFEMMKAQSETTRGLMSTLKDSINAIFLTIGQPMNDAFKPILEGAIQRSKLFGIQLQGIIQLFAEAGKQGQLGTLIGSSLQVAGIRFVNLVSGGFRGAVGFLGAAIPSIFSESRGLIFNSSLAQSIKAVFQAAGETLKAATLRGAEALVEALGLFNKLPGISGIKDGLGFEAGLAEGYAKTRFMRAQNQLQFGDFGKDFQKVTDALQRAGEAGAEAWRNATSDPLLDDTAALARWEQVAKQLNPEAGQRILNPGAFVEGGLGEDKDTETEGLKTALDLARGKTEEAENATAENTSALRRNSEELAKRLAGPQVPPPDRPMAGGSVFSVAESLALQFGRLENKRGMNFNEFINKSLGGRRAVRQFARDNDLTLAEARKRLVALGKGAAPGAKKKAAPRDPKIDLAREIRDEQKRGNEILENLAVA
jgi:tape measure domain-containing protein